MANKPPKEIFQAIKDTELIALLAAPKGIEVVERSRKALVSELTNLVTTNGLHILLKTLKAKTLKSLAEKLDWGDKKVPSGKGVLAKKIFEEMQSKPKKFLEDNYSNSELKQILTDLDVVIPDKKSDYVETILAEADSMGVENLLSSQPAENLKKIAKSCGLSVESGSIDILIDCIMSQEDFEAPKKKTDDQKEKPSKKKPALDKHITKTDLLAHYYREELVKFCQSKDILASGSKKDLAERIVLFLAGKEVPKKAEKRGRKKKEKSSDDDASEKSEKSDKSDKSDKSEKEKKSKQKEEVDKEDKGKSEKDRVKKDDVKSEKGKSEKKEEEKSDTKGKPEKTKKDNDKPKADKGKADKAKSDKGKSDKGKSDKGKSKSTKSDEKSEEKSESEDVPKKRSKT